MPQPPDVQEVYTVLDAIIDGDEQYVIVTADSPPLRRLSYRWGLEVLSGEATGKIRQILNDNQKLRMLTVDSIEGILPGDTWRYF